MYIIKNIEKEEVGAIYKDGNEDDEEKTGNHWNPTGIWFSFGL
jgi:hypothetical protein